MEIKINKIPIIVSMVMLLFAISSIFPSGYYVLLRFVACAAAILCALYI
jgi:hypothetical protein